MAVDGNSATRNPWRHRHAKKYAQPWRKPVPDIISGLVVGAGGGTWVGNVTSWPTLNLVLIAVGWTFVGAILPYLAVYAFAGLTAGGRIVRERLEAIEGALEALNDPALGVAPARSVSVLDIPGVAKIYFSHGKTADLWCRLLVTNYKSTPQHFPYARLCGNGATTNNVQLSHLSGASISTLNPNQTGHVTCSFRGLNAGEFDSDENYRDTVKLFDQDGSSYEVEVEFQPKQR
jgi:hypothetical protein